MNTWPMEINIKVTPQNWVIGHHQIPSLIEIYPVVLKMKHPSGQMGRYDLAITRSYYGFRANTSKINLILPRTRVACMSRLVLGSRWFTK
jgi:hypothetical protein